MPALELVPFHTASLKDSNLVFMDHEGRSLTSDKRDLVLDLGKKIAGLNYDGFRTFATVVNQLRSIDSKDYPAWNVFSSREKDVSQILDESKRNGLISDELKLSMEKLFNHKDVEREKFGQQLALLTRVASVGGINIYTPENPSGQIPKECDVDLFITSKNRDAPNEPSTYNFAPRQTNSGLKYEVKIDGRGTSYTLGEGQALILGREFVADKIFGVPGLTNGLIRVPNCPVNSTTDDNLSWSSGGVMVINTGTGLAIFDKASLNQYTTVSTEAEKIIEAKYDGGALAPGTYRTGHTIRTINGEIEL